MDIEEAWNERNMVKQLNVEISLLLLIIGEVMTIYVGILNNVSIQEIAKTTLIFFGIWATFVSTSEIFSRIVDRRNL